MADLKSATPKTPETGMKLYATDKKLNFVPQCNDTNQQGHERKR